MKQIKIKNAIYGKNVFNSRIELAYYRKYKRKRIEVTGTDFAPIRLLHKLFGGRIYKSKIRTTAIGNKTKPQEIWVALNETAYKVCKTVLPYLLTKQRIKKAKEIIKYYE